MKKIDRLTNNNIFIPLVKRPNFLTVFGIPSLVKLEQAYCAQPNFFDVFCRPIIDLLN